MEICAKVSAGQYYYTTILKPFGVLGCKQIGKETLAILKLVDFRAVTFFLHHQCTPEVTGVLWWEWMSNSTFLPQIF